jgi:DNA-binding beta-propeller fold protein YncE
VYVSDLHNNRIQKFTSDGTFITKWGTEGSGDGQFAYPFGIAVHSSGRVYVADDHNYRIQVFLWNPIFHNPIEPPVAGLK